MTGPGVYGAWVTIPGHLSSSLSCYFITCMIMERIGEVFIFLFLAFSEAPELVWLHSAMLAYLALSFLNQTYRTFDLWFFFY